MKKKENNYAFIDGQNLYLAIQELGWKLDIKNLKQKKNPIRTEPYEGLLIVTTLSVSQISV